VNRPDTSIRQYTRDELDAAFPIDTTVVNRKILPFPGAPLLGMAPAIMANRQSNSLGAAQSGIEHPDSSFAQIATKCPQVAQSLATGGNDEPYPLWYEGHLTLAHFCVDGHTLAHEVSKGDPRYDAANVDKHIQQVAAEVARKGLGAPLCKSYNGYRTGVCTTCPLWAKSTARSPWGSQRRSPAAQLLLP
jgi:hypothetical protein